MAMPSADDEPTTEADAGANPVPELTDDERAALLAETAERSSDVVVITDVQGTILWANAAAEELTGHTRAEMRGTQAAALRAAVHDDEAFFEQVMGAVSAGRPFRSLMVGRKRSGELFYADVTVTPVPDGSGNITRMVTVARDLAQQKPFATEMRRLAYFDPLTGLANRSLFADRLTQALGRASSSGRTVAVVSLDLDGFKRINDALGQVVGDEVLRAVSKRLTRRLREADTVGRLGSDEFGIILVDVKQPTDVPLVLDKIMGVFAEPTVVGDRDLLVGASAGVSVFPDDGADPQALLKQSGIALSKARNEGPGSRRFYAREMDVRAGEYLATAARLRHAVERDEFLAYFQPYFAAVGGEMVGMEALIRWRTPDLGIVPPNSFIPVLEDTGLIVEAGYWMIGEVCRRLRTWKDSGRAIVPVAVNLSPLQFRQRDLAGAVGRIAAEHGVHPRLLVFEITESTFMHDLGFTRATLEDLKRLGASIAIDDFGTGYSSLNYLKRFPVDYLKIDQSFIRELSTDLDDAALVSAIVSMAHNLGIRTIAEGVETAEQLKILRILRCDVIQGYLYTRPIPGAEEERLFSDWVPGH